MNKRKEQAKTFSFGQFRSGFIKHAEALAVIEDKLVVNTTEDKPVEEVAAPSAEPAAKAKATVQTSSKEEVSAVPSSK